MEELECIPLLDGVRKILARSTGGSEDSEFGGVVLRQVPVAQRVVPQEDIRGEVMDFIVQQIEDTDLSPAYVWAIATKVANKISEAIPSNIQINALNDVAKKELDSLCAKIEADPSILEVRSSSSSISVKALRNARRTMEDRHVIISDLNLVAGLEISPHYEYYAVFDGHGGRDAANYCAAHFHLVLAHQLRSGLEVPAAMEKAFKIVDGNFCDRALEMARKAGSTAVVALIVDRKTLHVGWLGDSEAVLARDGQAQALVRPHKPSVISEQERIERLGGEVISMMGVHRVNANLAVSRAVGDVEHKPFVSNDAEVTTVELDDLCDFIVLGCDGLFDLLSHQDVVVNAYHSALTRRFDTSVAENLTRSAISSGSTDNVTTIVVNLRDPKKWHFESVVFPKPEATDRVTPVAGKNLNGSPESAAPNMPLAGGDSSPVREVAAGFVSDTVEMALNRVNGAPPSNLDLACDLSPPEEEQRDLMATLKNDTPEADRLNPDAPEFVPSFPTASTAPELPNQSSSEENTEATVITASSQPDTMPKSESRDELVYEIDRELGTAPQAVQAELVNLDVSSAAGVSPPKAAEALSDSDEDLNSMVVHEDQPQPEIKLSELIVREQHIHVIPEESPSDEISSPMPEANAIPEAAAAPEVTQNGSNVDQLVDLQDDTKSPPPTPVHTAVEDAVDAAQASAAINVEQVVDLVSGLQEQVAEKSVQNLVENPQVSEDLVDLASQVLQGDVLEQIEHSDPCKPACKSPVSEAPVKVEDSQYLFSADVGVHEEAIVPRAQPLLFDGEESSADNALVDAIDNLILDEAPKVVDAIEKPSEPKTVDEAAVQVAEFVADTKIEDTFDFSTGSIELDSVKDVVEKLSAANESREETVAAPIIPDSIPQAEGVQDVDSESDNDAQEWSFVKPVEQQQQPPPSESQEAVSATAAAAAVVAATSVAAAVVATTAEPTPSATPAATPKATEKPKAPARAAKSASASKPSPAKTPTSAASAKTAAVKASPKTTTPLKPAAKPQSASPAPSKPTPARVSATAAKTSAATKPPAPKAPAPKPAPARPAGTTKAAAPAPPKPSSTATSKAPAAPRPAVSKPAPAKPVTSTTAKTTAAASTRPAVSARAPATSAASKPVASRPASTKPPAPKAPTKPATTASATATNKASSVATTKTTASTARPTAPKPAVSSTGVKKTTTTNSTATGAASSASRVAAARVAAARTAVKTTQPTPAATSSSAKPKTGAAKTASSTAAGKVAPKSPVKKAVKQEKKAPAAAPEEAPKENGSANAVSQTNGHASPHVENGSSDPSGPVPAEAPAVPSSEGQGDILV